MSITDENGVNQSYGSGPVQQIRMRRRAEKIIEEIEILKPQKVLELGCGSGELSRYLSDLTSAQIIATDVSSKMLNLARENKTPHNLVYEQADLLDQSFLQKNRNYFDAVVGNGILHHLVKDIDTVLPLVSSCLKPGGKLVFWEPNLSNPYVYLIFKIPLLRKLAKLDANEMAFSASYIKGKFAESDLECKVTCADFLIPNAPYALVNPIVRIGGLLEKTPVRVWAQSLFIVANKRG